MNFRIMNKIYCEREFKANSGKGSYRSVEDQNDGYFVNIAKGKLAFMYTLTKECRAKVPQKCRQLSYKNHEKR